MLRKYLAIQIIYIYIFDKLPSEPQYIIKKPDKDKCFSTVTLLYILPFHTHLLHLQEVTTYICILICTNLNCKIICNLASEMECMITVWSYMNLELNLYIQYLK